MKTLNLIFSKVRNLLFLSCCILPYHGRFKTEMYSTINNKFRSFLGRIAAETDLKMDYFGCKSQKIAKCWGLRLQTPLPLAAGGFAPTPFRFND